MDQGKKHPVISAKLVEVETTREVICIPSMKRWTETITRSRAVIRIKQSEGEV